MSFGRLVLAAAGAALIVTGIVVAIAASSGPGLGVTVIGLVTLVLGVADWHEFEAQISALRLRIAHAPPAQQPLPPKEPSPDIRILTIHARGGHSGVVDFAAELVNYGDRQARCTVEASVDGTPVEVDRATVDLIPDRSPEVVRVFVPRPALGELMLPEIPAEPTTLYGKTLTVVVDDGEKSPIAATWREPIFDPDVDAARAGVQQRYWRRARGEVTPEDLRAEAVIEYERRIDERHRR